MKDHAQFAEDLALYAMGALDARSCPELQAHLGACGECRRELEALRGDVALLALSATGPQPPQRSRQRLMGAVAKSQTAPEKKTVVMRRVRPRWLFWAPLAACLVLAAFTAHVMWVHHRSQSEFEQLQAELQKERVEHAHAEEIIAMLNDPNAQQMTLVSARTPAQPQVKTIYQRDKGHVLVMANNLPQPPPSKAYELWLLPEKGSPMPAGTFKTDWRGHGMMLHAMETAGVQAKGFAVTIEPEGGSQTPTMPIILAPGE